MQTVKMFYERYRGAIEKQANEFLKENPNLQIEEVSAGSVSDDTVFAVFIFNKTE